MALNSAPTTKSGTEGVYASPEKLNDALRNFTWGKVTEISTWNATHRGAIDHSSQELQHRENILAAAFNKIKPSELISQLKRNLGNLPDSEKLNILGTIPFSRLSLSPEEKKEISKYALDVVQKYAFTSDDARKYFNALPPSLASVRSMAKQGLLDKTQFLSKEDNEKIKASLEAYYFSKNKTSMFEVMRDVAIKGDSSAREINTFKEISLSEESQNEVLKYFGNKNCSLKIQSRLSENGYDEGYSNLSLGAIPSDKKLKDSMFPMNQRTSAGFMPGNDFRLNFQFDENNYENIARITADVMAYAQMKGIPITSKITSPEDGSGFRGRMLFYVDHNISQMLADYMKEKKYIPEQVGVSMNEKNTYPIAALSKDNSIMMRGSHEADNDAQKTYESFQWILNGQKA